jgi:hypothetical protein
VASTREPLKITSSARHDFCSMGSCRFRAGVPDPLVGGATFIVRSVWKRRRHDPRELEL